MILGRRLLRHFPCGSRSQWLPALGVLAVIGIWQASELAAQRTSAAGGQGPLWVSESPLDDGRRLFIVVDQEGRHAAIYHVDTVAGTLTLKSTRDISWDLIVGDFNAQEPRPAALQRMLQIPAAEKPR
jgi:hypothetical protein